MNTASPIAFPQRIEALKAAADELIAVANVIREEVARMEERNAKWQQQRAERREAKPARR